MARSIDKGGQDIALYHMEKLARTIENKKELTIKEQLAAMDLPLSERLKRMSDREWNIEVRDYLIYNSDRKENVGEKLYRYVTAKYKTEVESFHKNGTPFKEIRAFYRSKMDEHINL